MPIAIAWRAVNAAGSGISQSPFSRAFWARPPQCFSPTPQPLRTTLSPALKSAFELSVTTPARSMPGTIGKLRTTGDFAVMARPSL